MVLLCVGPTVIRRETLYNMQNEIADMIAQAQIDWDEREQMRINRFIQTQARNWFNSDEEVEDFKNTPKSMQLLIMWQIEETSDLNDQIDKIRTYLEEAPI